MRLRRVLNKLGARHLGAIICPCLAIGFDEQNVSGKKVLGAPVLWKGKPSPILAWSLEEADFEFKDLDLKFMNTFSFFELQVYQGMP